MFDHPSWRPLPLLRPDLPSLLVSTTFTVSPASYTVHVTDMANIWSENLERKGIFKRSIEMDTSIDPSEDQQNMRKFLKSLRSALNPNDDDHDDHEETSLFLSLADNAEDRHLAGGDDGLILHITCVLPAPFKPLKWPMYLKKDPTLTLTTQLVVPLIQAQYTRARESDALAAALRDKDAVINKMIDKLEALGVTFEQIFTLGSNKRKATRAQAEERIKGLAPFDESDFREKMDKAHDSSLSGLVQGVFGNTGGLTYTSELLLDDDVTLPLNDWWTGLGGGGDTSSNAVSLPDRKKGKESKKGQENRESAAAGRKSRAETSPNDARQAMTGTKPAADQDDDNFQVQFTPPHLQSAARKRDTTTRPTTTAGEDDETTDDDSPSQIPDSYPPPQTRSLSKPKPRLDGLGGLGGGKKKAVSPSPTPSPNKFPTPPPPPKRATPMADDGSDTASEADSPPPQRSPSPRLVPRKGRLGRLGGRRGKSASRTPPPELERHATRSPSSARQRGKLGQLGGRRRDTPSSSQAGSSRTATAGDDEARERSADKMDVDDEPRDDSDDRADQKRAELQKELDRKKAAVPAKKRKF